MKIIETFLRRQNCQHTKKNVYITTVSLNTCSYINGLDNSELSESNKAEVGLVNQYMYLLS